MALVSPQLPSSSPKVPADRLATLTPSAFPTVATHSMPHNMLASEPLADRFKTWMG
jgi:hypothetical protein